MPALGPSLAPSVSKPKAAGLFWLSVLLPWLVACDPAPAPVASIEQAPYYQDPALLDRAWRLPVAHFYRDRFEYQINSAFCGPATAINLFHSLDIPGRTQENLFDHAPWRYWKTRLLGLNLDELAEIVQDDAGLEITVLRDLTLETFRAHLRQSNNPAYRYLINFNRQPLFGVKIGHHSPIGGYLTERDLVFVLDVLERYQPFLAPSQRLYEAMDTVDRETGKKRGLLLVRKIDDAASGDP